MVQHRGLIVILKPGRDPQITSVPSEVQTDLMEVVFEH